MSDAVHFSVNIDGPLAVYQQIENQVRFAVASGRYKPGEKLPSVRELSAHIETNPNTVTKAYRDLEIMGIVKMRRGVGVTVAQDAPSVCREGTRRMVLAHLDDAVAECLACGFGSDEVLDAAGRVLESGRRPYQTD